MKRIIGEGRVEDVEKETGKEEERENLEKIFTFQDFLREKISKKWKIFIW